MIVPPSTINVHSVPAEMKENIIDTSLLWIEC